VTRLLCALLLLVTAQTCAAPMEAQHTDRPDRPTLTFVLPGDSIDPAPRAGTVWYETTTPTAFGVYGFYWVRVAGYRERLLARVPATLPADVQLRDLKDSALAKAAELRAMARWRSQFACDTLPLNQRPTSATRGVFGGRCT
jgi:hypothetical protein